MSTPNPLKAPRLVQAYLDREQTYDSPEEMLEVARIKIKQYGWSPAVLTYMMGCEYAEARSIIAWIERLDAQAQPK